MFDRTLFRIRAALADPDRIREVCPMPEPGRAMPRIALTAFSGNAVQWRDYLAVDRVRRYDEDVRIRIDLDAEQRILAFHADTEAAEPLAAMLTTAWGTMERLVASKPHVQAAYDDLVFRNESNRLVGLDLRTSRTLPSEGTREVRIDGELLALGTTIVLARETVDDTLARWAALSHHDDEELVIGTAFPVLIQLLASLGYPNYPRDRFVERIDLTRKQTLVGINLLFEKRRLGRLVPNRAGRLFREHLTRRDGIPEEELDDRHPLMAMLNDLAFLLNERRADDFADQARIHIRQLLDDRYIRPNVGRALPTLGESKRAMPCRILGSHSTTPKPEVGRNGVVDREDLRAWRTIERELADTGFRIVRQLGIGQFGRVYEAINLRNSSLPARVAIKIDRLTHKNAQMIQDPIHAMELGNRLALAPHVIRIYDAGRLPRSGLSYHVLQLVDGETLDDLLGITGQEHASVDAFNSRRDESGHDETVRVALSDRYGEYWRLRGHVTPFSQELSLSQTMDILTSIVLWLEEIHGLGFAINDLKNGNLMISRRGQLKGIDLDSYAPVFTDIERMVDFKFLAISTLLFVLNASGRRGFVPQLDSSLLRDPGRTRDLLRGHWTYADAAGISHGRVETDEIIAMLARIITRCNDNSYTYDSARFSADIDRFVRLKRRVFLEEIVLD